MTIAEQLGAFVVQKRYEDLSEQARQQPTRRNEP